jgi:uncharacterized RDD family membrane protein YckC
VAKLIVNPSSASRREIPLPRTVLSIGRDPGNDVVLPDAMVSRRHAVVEFRGSQYYIRDCNSSNGSLVNGDRVSERNLRDGDLVAIGTARILFRDELNFEDSSGKIVQHPSSPRLSCAHCGADYRKGDLYCRQCGAGIAPPPPAKAVCATCGTAVPLPAKFCSGCGQNLPEEVQGALAASSGAAAAVAPAPPPAEAAAHAEAEAPAADAAPAVAAPPEAVAPPEARPELGLALEALKSAVPQSHNMPAPPAPRPLAAPIAPASFRAVPVPKPVVRAAGPRGVSESASAGARLAAGLADMAIVGFGQFLLIGPVAWYWWGRELPRDPAQVPYLPILLSLAVVPVSLLAAAAYFVHGWGAAGATPGKRLLGLAVETEKGGYPIGVPCAATRFFGYCLSGLLFGFGFLMIFFVGEGLHDRIAHTRVVRRDD